MTDSKLYNDIKLSKETIKRRNQIKNLQDEFMTFSWGGFDAFDNFGAFIINEQKGSLKFYNGPGFTNEYTKPQFDNGGGELMGVTFNKQTISFTIGVYWINIHDYRLLLNWLHPLKINYLTFGFNKEYRYNVKLSKIGDSTRYIVGKEAIYTVEGKIDHMEPMYYTELSLSFELQGVPCAKGIHSYEFAYWVPTGYSSSNLIILETSIKKNNDNTFEFIESDLPTPLEIPFNFQLAGETNDQNRNIYHEIILKAKYHDIDENDKPCNEQEQILFSVVLKNLTLFTNSITNLNNSAINLNLKYNSETGLLFLKYGNSNDKILNLLNTSDTGEKIVDSFMINKFSLPGQFNYPGFNTTNLKLELTINKYSDSDEEKIILPEQFYKTLVENDTGIICYPRTNII